MRKLIVILILTCSSAFAEINYFEWGSEPTSLGGVYYTMITGGAPTPTSDLVLEYLFGANGSESTITLDTSGNSYTGTVSGATWNVATNGLTDVYDFDGDNDEIDVSDSFIVDGLTSLTFDVWFYADTRGINEAIVSANGTNNVKIAFGSANPFEIALTLNNGLSNITWTTDAGTITPFNLKWYNVVATWQSGLTPDLYVNGLLASLDKSDTLTGSISQDDILKFGVDDTGAGLWLDGKIALPQISSIYYSSNTVVETNIIRKATIGIVPEYFLDNRTAYTNCSIVFTHSALKNDGSKYDHAVSTGSSPVFTGSSSNGWAIYNGVANKITFQDHPILSFTNFTFHGWVKSSTTAGYQAILSKWAAANEYIFEQRLDQYYITINNGGVYRIGTGAGTVSTSTWQNVTASYDSDSDNLRVYIDGVLKNSATVGRTVTSGANVFEIGSVGAGNLWSGAMDDIVVESYTQTSNEVYNYYTNSKAYLGH